VPTGSVTILEARRGAGAGADFVSAAQLVREGGEEEIRIADAELISATRRDGP
jgi:hypothetical protein